MRNKRLRKILYSSGTLFSYTAVASITALGLISEIDPANAPHSTWPEPIKAAIVSINDWSLLGYSSALFFLLVGFLAKHAGDPWVWDKLQYLIDKMRDKVYDGYTQGRLDQHRVTLFKRRRFVLRIRRPGTSLIWPYGRCTSRYCFPWEGWLVPVLRSGHTSQSTKSVFLAPHGNNSHEVDGVVGQAWARNTTVIVNDLPELNSDSPPDLIEEYSRKTFCDSSIASMYFQQGRMPPRSIGAIPIEVTGSIWGALVLDSADPQGVTEESINNFTLTAGLIGQLLEKG